MRVRNGPCGPTCGPVGALAPFLWRGCAVWVRRARSRWRSRALGGAPREQRVALLPKARHVEAAPHRASGPNTAEKKKKHHHRHHHHHGHHHHHHPYCGKRNGYAQAAVAEQFYALLRAGLSRLAQASRPKSMTATMPRGEVARARHVPLSARARRCLRGRKASVSQARAGKCERKRMRDGGGGRAWARAVVC